MLYCLLLIVLSITLDEWNAFILVERMYVIRETLSLYLSQLSLISSHIHSMLGIFRIKTCMYFVWTNARDAFRFVMFRILLLCKWVNHARSLVYFAGFTRIAQSYFEHYLPLACSFNSTGLFIE